MIKTDNLRVLVITSEWPTLDHPESVPFLVREVESLRQLGLTIDVFSFRGAMNPINYFQAWSRLRRYLKKEKYDLYHAQFGQSGLLAILPKLKPLVVTYQGSDLNGMYALNGKLTFPGFLLRAVSQWVALFADEIILVSGYLAKYLPRKRYEVIPGGIDLSLFSPISKELAKKQLGLANDVRYVLFAGGINNPIKRFELAKTAIDLVPTSERVQILLANGIAPTKMPIYMGAADALLVTSSREGSPNVIKEALACNLPIISVDVGDVRSRLEKVQGCIVCSDDTPETIAKAILSVLKANEPINGRDVVQELELSVIAQKIVNVYHRALARDIE